MSKVKFANAIAAEGISINTDYRDITCEWQWIPKYVREYKKTFNSLNFRDKTFNILFHEQFGDKDACIDMLRKREVIKKKETDESKSYYTILLDYEFKTKLNEQELKHKLKAISNVYTI